MSAGTKKHKIGNIAAAILVLTAIIADLISLIPLGGDIVGPIFWVCVSFYFWKSGLGLINSRRLATSAISLVAELIPGIQELPAILLGIVVIIAMTRFEDKTGISVTSAVGGKSAGALNSSGVRAPIPRTPLNRDSVRLPNGGLKS